MKDNFSQDYGGPTPWKCVFNVIRTQAAVAEVFRQIVPDGEISIALDSEWAVPFSDSQEDKVRHLSNHPPLAFPKFILLSSFLTVLSWLTKASQSMCTRPFAPIPYIVSDRHLASPSQQLDYPACTMSFTAQAHNLAFILAERVIVCAYVDCNT